MDSDFPLETLFDTEESKDFGDTEVNRTDEEYIRIQLEAHDKG